MLEELQDEYINYTNIDDILETFDIMDLDSQRRVIKNVNKLYNVDFIQEYYRSTRILIDINRDISDGENAEFDDVNESALDRPEERLYVRQIIWDEDDIPRGRENNYDFDIRPLSNKIFYRSENNVGNNIRSSGDNIQPRVH